jgi:hypothetical protein
MAFHCCWHEQNTVNGIWSSYIYSIISFTKIYPNIRFYFSIYALFYKVSHFYKCSVQNAVRIYSFSHTCCKSRLFNLSLNHHNKTKRLLDIMRHHGYVIYDISSFLLGLGILLNICSSFGTSFVCQSIHKAFVIYSPTHLPTHSP